MDFDEDDPKKCTGKKMVRANLAEFTLKPKGIILNPASKITISIDDKIMAEKIGITVIDSSWNKSDERFFLRFINRYARRLPLLLAGNPINYGKPYKLSSIEAVAAALYILDDVKLAMDFLSLYKWGETFYTLNKELLESYRGKDRVMIEKEEREIIDKILSNS